MTSDTATPVDARKAVVTALRALDRAALVPVLDAGHASRLAPTLGLVAAGATLSDEQVRDAARVLHAARDRIGGPLSAMGVTVPEPPAPVTRPDPPAAKADQARPKVLMGADGRILVDSAYELRDTMKAIPGGQVVPADIRRRGMRAGTDPATGQPRRVHPSWSYPATPASAATLVYTLRPFDPMVWPAVRNLVAAHFETKRARESLVDESVPLPEHTPDGTDEVTMPLWDHQRRAIAIAEASSSLLAAMPMGCQSLSTPVLTPSGWRKMGELAVGDYVFGGDGKPTHITKVHDYERALTYEVTFSDGSSTNCTGDHRWTVLRRNSTAGPRVVTLDQMLAEGLYRHWGNRKAPTWYLPEQPVIEMTGSTAGLAVDPWLLGVLLGDGALWTSPTVEKSDPWLHDELARVVGPLGMHCSPITEGQRPGRTPGSERVVGVRLVRDARSGLNPLTEALRELGVWEVRDRDKAIPPAYLSAPTDDRRAILQGLMDTDGHAYAGSGAQFTSGSQQLAEDVAFLVRSLGGRARVGRNDTGGCWYVLMRFWSGWTPFRMPRKAERYRNARTRPWVSIRSAVPLRTEPVRCISVESSMRMYLTDTACIPTHNSGKTSMTIALVNRRGWRRVLIVAPNRVRAVWTREVRERSTQDWHIEDGTRPAKRRGARPQDLSLSDRLSRAEYLLDDCDCGATTHAFVLNYEAMLSSEWQDWVPSEPLDAIVYDEAHRLQSYQMYPQRPGRKIGPAERKLGPQASAEQKAAARRLDAMGPAERALRDGDEPPTAGDLQRARARDKVTAKNEAEAEAKRLTISGLASRWVSISRFRMGLTGTPFAQHPWSIFGIMRALDPGVFGELWTPFRDYYLQMDASGNFPVRVAKARLEEFARRAMSLMYRPVVDLDLPGCTDVVRTVYLEPAARRAYDQLDAELFTDLRRFLAARGDGGSAATAALSGVAFAAADESDSEDGELADGDDDGTMLTAKSLLSQLLRLQQITGGTLQADDGTGPHGERVPGPQARVSTAKIDMLGRLRKLPGKQAKAAGHTHELVGGDLFDVGCVPGRTDADGTPVAPEPVIVYCRFKADLDMVCELVEAAGLRYGEISGRSGKPDGLGPDARMAPDVDVVGVQIQAGGTGIDLTRSAVGIWYSLGYSVSDYDQARARPYRPGQTRPVRFIHYVAADTKDEAVYDAIDQRRSAVSEVLRAGGVDPAALGIVDRDHGADPNAGQIGGRDNAQSAVSLPWESGKDGRR